MKDDLRRFLASDPQRIARVAKFLSDNPETEADLDEVLLEARISAAERLDPASAPSSLWLVRLAGAHIEDGWLDSSLQESIVGPLGREVEHATPSSARSESRLGLVGVSTGSVVLHFRPRIPLRNPDEGHLSFATSPVDAAILRVSQLHNLLESGAPAAEIASQFKEDQSLLRQARFLVNALAKNGIELSTRWWASDSSRSTSRLSHNGQRHALRVFESAIKHDTEHVHGMVTALDIAGILTVSGASKMRWRVNVGHEEIRSPRFALGAQVHFEAERKVEVDQMGNKLSHPTYTFVRHIEHLELPFESNQNEAFES